MQLGHSFIKQVLRRLASLSFYFLEIFEKVKFPFWNIEMSGTDPDF